MSNHLKIAAGGIIIALILLIVGVPFWALGLVVLAALAVPVAGYLMLDPSQRRRIRAIQQRRK